MDSAAIITNGGVSENTKAGVDSVLHEWKDWRIQINEGMSTNCLNRNSDTPATNRPPASSFMRDIAVPNFGPDMRQTYGRKAGSQVNSAMTNDLYLMYGIPRVSIRKL